MSEISTKGSTPWRTIDTIPQDGTKVLCWRNGDIDTAWHQTYNDKPCIGGKGWFYPEWDMPTHWRPMLPGPDDPQSVENLALDYAVHLLYDRQHEMGAFGTSTEHVNLFDICQAARGEGSGDVPLEELRAFIEKQMGRTS